MAKTSEFTSFTKDIQGRYLCNDFSEAEAWRQEGGRPFDIIVVGGGTFGAGIAEHLWYRQRQAGGGLRTLVVEAGRFTLPEHVQNTGILGPFRPRHRFLPRPECASAGAAPERGLGRAVDFEHTVQGACLQCRRQVAVLGRLVAAPPG